MARIRFVGLAVLGLAFLSASLAGCSSQPPEPGRYYKKAEGFSIRFPAEWEQKENVMGSVVIALSPAEGADDAFRENVNVVVEALPSPMTLDEYFNLSMANLRKLLTEARQPEIADARIGGEAAKQVVYQTTMGQIRVKSMLYVAVKGQRGYAVTCSATPDSFDAYKARFEEIAGTFRFE
ncbi:MAG: hypothetical protein WBD75_10330 [Phycisphaerae bacterium]